MKKLEKISLGMNCTIGVGILSWKSHKTLEKSLISYENVNFKELFDDVKIIFQEISKEDIILADRFGYDYVGTEKNLGIQNGHKLIYENLKTDYIIVLENDNPIIVKREELIIKLRQSINLLINNKIDLMRLRHRWTFGEGFSLEKYINYYSIEKLHEKYNQNNINKSFLFSLKKLFKRLIRPGKAIRLAGYSLYFEKEPEKKFPKYIKKLDDELFSVSSYIIPWTNQSVLIHRQFYGNLISYAYNNPSSRTANGFQDLEKPLNCKWWRNQNFRIGVGEGIFTHNRFDDSWRKEHPAYNKIIIK